MTFWLDAQLDPSLAAWIGSRFGVIAKHVVEMTLEKADDRELYEAGRRFAEIVILSKDADFADLSKSLGAPPQIVHLRCGNLNTPQLQMFLSLKLGEAIERLKKGEALVVIDGPRP
jgi:predicted nuclease of predicted toxin-antitoxin system